MRIRFFRTSRWPRAPWWALGLCFGWLVLVGWVWHLEQRTGLTPETCLIHGLFDVPCPTCGSTRVVTHLLAGRTLQAFGYNPLVFLGLVVGGMALVLRMVTGWWVELDLGRSGRSMTLAAGIFLLLANWAWLLVNR